MSSDRISRWVRPEIRALSAYHVPPARGFVKLDAMENPYPWPAGLQREWLEKMPSVALNRYPDPQSAQLKSTLREVMSVPASMEILLGNGSDELIQLIAMAVAGPERVMLAPEPTFVMYRMIAIFTGMRFVGVPLREDFALDGEAMLAAIERHQPAVVFLAYPNNPTGNLFDRDTIDRIVARSPGLVVIDEAYHAFAEASYMNGVGRADNVIVMRTLSKMGLAGLRLGLIVGPSAWLDEFEKLRLPYNINSLTQMSAEFALRHHDVFDAQTARIRAERGVLFDALREVAGVRAYPSHANFILFRVPAGRAGEIYEGLKQRGVLIKNLHRDGSPLSDCLRVTVGTPAENQQFLAALRAALDHLGMR
jgi:histidinol-phosphate aminotransferase